jgi:MFS family permease
MATIALTADLTARTHSPWWVSLLFVVTFLPSVVVGLAFGPLVDRLSRKRLIVNADVIRLAVFVALVFVHSPAAIIGLAAIAGAANSSPKRTSRMARRSSRRPTGPRRRSGRCSAE